MFSIIMPAYNSEKYIREAVTSVINQSCRDWELIIIDDASGDNTKETVDALCMEFPDNSSKIRYVKNETNMGAANSRNRGIKLAKGEWIAFLDSDDLWRGNKLEKVLDGIKNDPICRLWFTASDFIDEKGRKLDACLHVPEKIGFDALCRQNIISCSSVVINRDLISKYPFPTVSGIHEDFANWLTILKNGEYARGIDEPLLIYRIVSVSKSGNKLKSAVMTWKSYRYMGFSFSKSLACFVSYAARSAHKYSDIY